MLWNHTTYFRSVNSLNKKFVLYYNNVYFQSKFDPPIGLKSNQVLQRARLRSVVSTANRTYKGTSAD